MERQPRVALAGPRLLNGDGSLQRSCYRFPSPGRAWAENLWISAAMPSGSFLADYRRWAHDREQVVDWLTGACCLVRREVYEQVGGFDERFFMYAEETDWQRRMRDAGWKIAFAPGAIVTHLGGASSAKDKTKINEHFFNSLDRYELKHHGWLGLFLLRLAMVVGCSLRYCAWLGVYGVWPSKREIAGPKLKLTLWLFKRQFVNWIAVNAGSAT
jgi:hypothetical protein